MLQKAIIKSIDEKTAIVRIPIFETAGSTQEYVTEANICASPGVINAYKPNDVVYVAFENMDFGKPVIMGKFYKGLAVEKEDNASSYLYNNSLTITDKAELPFDTKIGAMTYDDIEALRHDVALLASTLSAILYGSTRYTASNMQLDSVFTNSGYPSQAENLEQNEVYEVIDTRPVATPEQLAEIFKDLL